MDRIGESAPTVGRPGARARSEGLPGLAALAVRVALGALFLWAGILKLANPRAFAHVIDEYGIVPEGWPLVVAALALPALEALTGLGALFDRRWAWWLMLALLALFIGVLWFGILNDLDVDCGCFSLEERRGQAGLRAAFARDWVMAAAAAWVLAAGRGRRREGQSSATITKEGQA